MIERATAADVDECLPWALPRFKERFPLIDAKLLREWVLKNLNASNALFCRSENACGAINLAPPTLFEPYPIGKEIFVVGRPGHAREAVEIYLAMKKWSKGNGAKAFDFGSANGYDLSRVADILGGEAHQTIYRVRL